MIAGRLFLPLGCIVLAMILIGGCSSPPTRFYTLNANVPATSNRPVYLGAPVRVDAVHMPPAFDRLEIAYNVGQTELKIDDSAHWSAPLEQMARQALSADLTARLPADRVIFPHLPKPEGALGLTVDVLLFEVGGNGAHLTASWRLSATDGAEAIREGTVAVQSSSPVANAPSVAAALSDLLAQLADRIVAGL